MGYVVFGLRVVIGVVFVTAVIGKLRGYRAFRLAVGALAPGLPTGPAAWTVIATESAVVALLAMPWTATAGFVLALLSLTAFTAAIGRALLRGVETSCNCFGASASPIGRPQILRNALLIAVAGTGAVLQDLSVTPTVHPAGIVISVVAACMFSTAFVFFDDLTAPFAPLDGSR